MMFCMEVGKVSDFRINGDMFGMYVRIPTDFNGALHTYKVVCLIESNSYCDVPVKCLSEPVLHDNIVPVLLVIHCGVCEEKVTRVALKDCTLVSDETKKMDWFSLLADRLRDYSDGDIWSNGCEILCRTESAAAAIEDLLWQLYNTQGEDVSVITGYYDPDEDKRNDEEDRYTGWWYVTVE